MRNPRRITTGRLLKMFAVLALLCIVLHPELRVLILFVDAVGVEMLLLLFVLQARVVAIAFAPSVHSTALALCKAVSGFGFLALAAYPSRVYSCALHRLMCPILIGASYGVRCRLVP